MKVKRILFNCLLAFVLIVPLVFYCIQFHGYPLSNDPSDWGDFGDYVGGIYNVLVALVIFILSQRLERDSKRRDKVVSAAIDITNQIGKLRVSRNKIKSTEKLISLVISNKVYLDTSLYDQLLELTDNYQRVYKNEEKHNIKLEEKVLRKLKSLTE